VGEVRTLLRAGRGTRLLAHDVLRPTAFRAARTSPRDARAIRALAVELFPHSAPALVDLARSDAALGDTAAALASLRAASTLRPNDAVVRDLLRAYGPPHP
jgi:hypothetical protein